MELNKDEQKRERNRLQQQQTRASLTEEEKRTRQERDRLHHQQTRDSLTEEERNEERERNRLHHQQTRELLTEEEKRTRQEHDRLHHQQTREHKKAQIDVFRDADVQSILDEHGIPKPVSNVIKNKAVKNCIDRLHQSAFVCTCCDQKFWEQAITMTFNEQDAFWKQVKTQLKAPAGLPEALINCYDVSRTTNIQSLRSILLSERGIAQSDPVLFNFCTSCFHHLNDRRHTNPPIYAIANSNYQGSSDVLSSLNQTERWMCALHQAYTRVVNVSYSHHVFVENSMIFASGIPGAAQVLPRIAADVSTLKVVFHARPPEDAMSLIKKRYDADVNKLRAGMAFLKEHHAGYKNITVEFREDGLSVIEYSDDEYQLQEGSISHHGEPPVFEPQNEGTYDFQTNRTSYILEPVCLTEEHKMAFGKDHLNILQGKEKEINFLRSSIHTFFSEPGVAEGTLIDMFPFGLAGPLAQRRTRMTLRQFYQRLSRTGRYNHNYQFFALAYDHLRFENASHQLFFTLKYTSPAMKQGIENIDIETLGKALTEQVDYDRAVAACKKPLELARNLVVSVQENTVGHPEERRLMRKDLLSMVYEFGAFHIFVTMNPNDQNSLVLWNLANRTTQRLQVPDPLPSRAEIGRRIRGDSVTPQLNFAAHVQLFVDQLLGWNSDEHCSTKEGGIFGHVKAFYGSKETTGSGNLHLHTVVWLSGWPSNPIDLQSLRGNGDDTRAMFEFDPTLFSSIESIITTSYPTTYADDELHQCDHCNEKLEYTPLGARFHRRRYPNQKPPYVYRCPKCASDFVGSDLLQAFAERLLKNHENFVDAPRDSFSDLIRRAIAQGCLRETPDYEAFCHMVNEALGSWRTQGLTTRTHLSIQQLSELLKSAPNPDLQHLTSEIALYEGVLLWEMLRVQEHAHTHFQTCMQYGETCRMRYPRAPRSCSVFDRESGELVLKRDKLSEYFVQHCDSILRAFDCNSECQALFRTVHGSSSVIFYITEYITSWTKETGRPEFRNLINAFFRKKSYNPTANAQSILLSLYNALSFGKEVDMTMVVESLMTDSSYIASHTFRPFYLSKFMADMLGQNHFQLLTPDEADDQGKVTFTTAVNFATNYVYRPRELNGVCPFDFARYEKFCANDFDRDSEKEGNFRFMSDHPQSTTHLLRKTSNTLPSFHGRSFPFLRDLETANEAEEQGKEDADIQTEGNCLDAISEEERMLGSVGKSTIYRRQERVAAYLLFTFLPMRRIEDVKRPNERWWDAFHRHLPQLPQKRIDNIMNMYNDGAAQKRYKEQLEKERREAREDAKNEQGSRDSTILVLDTEDAMFVHEGDIKTRIKEQEEPEQEEIINWNIDVTVQDLLEGFQQQQAQSSFEDEKMKNLTKTFTEFINEALIEVVLPVRQDATIQDSDKSSSEIEKLLTRHVHGQPLRLLEHAPSVSVPSQPKIQQILALAEQNGTPMKRNQIRAFRMLASAFLKTIGNKHDPLLIQQIYEADVPLRMILTGKAGTGKSAVFKFLKIFIDAWIQASTNSPPPSRPYLFGVEFGSAAALIGASTNAKIAGQKKTITPTKAKYITTGKLFEGVSMFIMDEFSLTSKSTFLALNQSCQYAKHDKTKFFPKTHLVLSGDVIQIPPPHGYGIFRVAVPGKEDIKYSQLSDFVQSFRDVIILDEVVRTDPHEQELIELQEAARCGRWTKRHLDIVNSRKLSTFTRSQLSNIPLFIVGTNKEKAAINEALLKWYRDVREIQMFFWTNSEESAIDDATLPRLQAKWTAIDRILKRKGPQAGIIVPPFTYMFVGMSVTLTKNTAPSLGCANHATGKVQGIFFAKDTKFVNDGPHIVRASKPPTYVDVALDFTPVEMLEGYAANVRPVTLIRQDGKISYTFENETFNEDKYSYEGIPLLHTDATTVHGIQGLTISNRPICVHYPRKYFKNLPGVALYVILTRIKKLSDLFFAEEWTLEQLSAMRPEPYMFELWHTFEEKARLTEATYFPDENM